MDALRQFLFGISLGTAAAQTYLDQDQVDEARQAVDYVACAARQAFEQLEEMEVARGERTSA